MSRAGSSDAVPEVEAAADEVTLDDRAAGNVLRLIPGDLRAKARWLYGGDDWKQTLKAALTDGTSAMVLYRLMQQSTRSNLAPLAMIFNKLNGVLSSCVIGRGAEFGPEFVLVHAQGVVINGAMDQQGQGRENMDYTGKGKGKMYEEHESKWVKVPEVSFLPYRS